MGVSYTPVCKRCTTMYEITFDVRVCESCTPICVVRSIAPRNLLSSPLCKHLPSSSPRNHPRNDATRHLDGEVVKPRPEKPRRAAFQPSIFATNHTNIDGTRWLLHWAVTAVPKQEYGLAFAHPGVSKLGQLLAPMYPLPHNNGRPYNLT
jgi:hypothetical protein